MRITVHYLTQIKQATGCSAEPIDMAVGSNLADLVLQLAERHGGTVRAMLLDDSATPRRSLLYFVGDEHAELTCPLHEGDAVTLLAPMSGG